MKIKNGITNLTTSKLAFKSKYFDTNRALKKPMKKNNPKEDNLFHWFILKYNTIKKRNSK